MEIKGVTADVTVHVEEWPITRVIKPELLRMYNGFTPREGFWSLALLRDRREHFTEEFTSAVKAEVEWRDLSSHPDLPFERFKAVGQKRMECPRCLGDRKTFHQLRGNTTGLRVIDSRDCRCKLLIRFWLGMNVIPVEFQDARIQKMEPSTLSCLSLKRQREIIDYIKDHDSDRYFLWGPSSTGKSHMASAIYANSLSRWLKGDDAYTHECRSSRINASEMIEEWMDHKRDSEAPQPRVSVKNIRKHAADGGPRFVLVLEEIDKLNPNANRLQKMSEIINGYHEAGGQIIVTSNTSPGDLIKLWDEFPGKHGSTILRRIAQDPWGTTIQFADR